MLRLLMLICVMFTLSAQAGIVKLADSGLWYEHGEISDTGHPSYAGPMATATNKTMPVAMRGGDDRNYYTYSDCVDGQYRIYVATNDEKAIIFRSNYCDQHDNAAIRVASDGYIWVYKAARGYWRESFTYKSKQPYDILSGFNIVDKGYRAYPQAWSMGLIYTKYNEEKREPWVKANGCDKQLVTGGHYNMSYYDGKFIHLFYNYHKEKPVNDSMALADLNHRINLYYMRSANGCDWQNARGEALELPLVTDSDETRVYQGDEFIYLKDVKIVNGVPWALVAKSNSWDPTTGQRELYEIDAYGNEKYITEQNHNYDGAAYFGPYVAAVKGKEFARPGGDIHYYKEGVHIGLHESRGTANYPRKVIGFRGFIFTESSSSTYDAGDTEVMIMR